MKPSRSGDGVAVFDLICHGPHDEAQRAKARELMLTGGRGEAADPRRVQLPRGRKRPL